MNMTWDWGVFLRDIGDGRTYLGWLISAWGWTVAVAFFALIVSLSIGAIVGVLRTTPTKYLVLFGNGWTELFRNIPLLVQVFLWYFVLPELVPALHSISSYVLVSLALGFYTSARISEQVKAGIQSLPRGQAYAGQAIGLTLPQTYRYVLMPVALRIIIPPLTSEVMSLVKNSSVAFAVSIPELTMFAMRAQEETGRGVEIYVAVTALYFVSAYLTNRIMSFIEIRVRVPGMLGTK